MASRPDANGSAARRKGFRAPFTLVRDRGLLFFSKEQENGMSGPGDRVERPDLDERTSTRAAGKPALPNQIYWAERRTELGRVGGARHEQTRVAPWRYVSRGLRRREAWKRFSRATRHGFGLYSQLMQVHHQVMAHRRLERVPVHKLGARDREDASGK